MNVFHSFVGYIWRIILLKVLIPS